MKQLSRQKVVYLQMPSGNIRTDLWPEWQTSGSFMSTYLLTSSSLHTTSFIQFVQIVAAKTKLSSVSHCGNKYIPSSRKNQIDFKKRKLNFRRLCWRNVRLLVGALIAASGVAPVISYRRASFLISPANHKGSPRATKSPNGEGKKVCRRKREVCWEWENSVRREQKLKACTQIWPAFLSDWSS